MLVVVARFWLFGSFVVSWFGGLVVSVLLCCGADVLLSCVCVCAWCGV